MKRHAAAAAAAKSLQSCPTLWPCRRQPTRLPWTWDSSGKNTGVGCHFLLQCMRVKCESEVAQSCPTLSDPMDCSLPGSPIHGIFQARVLEWGAIAFSDEKTWRNLNCILLSGRNQSEKASYCESNYVTFWKRQSYSNRTWTPLLETPQGSLSFHKCFPFPKVTTILTFIEITKEKLCTVIWDKQRKRNHFWP